MKKTKKLALSAVLSAIGVVILFLGGLLGVLDISSACIASFIVLFIAVEMNQTYALISYVVISLLGLLVCGENLFAPICFAALFGPMAVTKYWFEKTGRVVSWILKLALPAATLSITYVFWAEILEIPDKMWLKVIYASMAFLIVWLTHMLYIMMTRIYFRRYRDKISKYLK